MIGSVFTAYMCFPFSFVRTVVHGACSRYGYMPPSIVLHGA